MPIDKQREIQKLWRQIFDLGLMPCCGLEILYQNGPCGGMSQNIRCCHCGAEWNISLFGPERISVSEQGFVESLQKMEARKLTEIDPQRLSEAP